jgi:hypothetical protein
MDFTLSSTGNVITLNPIPTISGYNKEYRVTVLAGISGVLPDGSTGELTTNYEFWFTTQYCPLFTTLNRVKLMIGPIADSIVEDTIYRMIYKNSLDAIDLYGLQNNVVVSPTTFGCTYESVPALLRRYVECKTAYDILALLRVNQTMGSGGGGGDQLKTLGDMTIKYGGSSGSSASGSGDPKLMNDLYNCWNEQLRMFGGGLRSTVKGYYDNSKGYVHPVRAIYDNRLIRPVIPHPQGNYTPGTTYYRGI